MVQKKTTWRNLIAKEMTEHGESFEDVITHVCGPIIERDEDWNEIHINSSLDAEFDPGFGGPEGCPFTLWTIKRVYFPVIYDGAEWVGSVSRYPDDKPENHFGGC